jgi:hypothetical protein
MPIYRCKVIGVRSLSLLNCIIKNQPTMGQKPAICFFLRTAGQVSIYPTPTHLFFL